LEGTGVQTYNIKLNLKVNTFDDMDWINQTENRTGTETEQKHGQNRKRTGTGTEQEQKQEENRNRTGTEQEQMEGSCKHGNEIWAS
jgi:hypothetical protein